MYALPAHSAQIRPDKALDEDEAIAGGHVLGPHDPMTTDMGTEAGPMSPNEKDSSKMRTSLRLIAVASAAAVGIVMAPGAGSADTLNGQSMARKMQGHSSMAAAMRAHPEMARMMAADASMAKARPTKGA